jgi:thiol:disulfide interchange protein DsbC
MRRSIQFFTFSSLALCVAAPVFAQDEFDVVEARIRELAPTATSIAVSETPIEGLLQVQVSGDIVYATTDGKYMVQGRIIDLETREDITELSKATLRKEILNHVDSSKQITFAPEAPAYDLTVFTDIDCGYCRKLHSQIAEYNKQGIAIHYMAFPRAGIGSESYDKAVSVWCAKDQQSALTSAKLGNDPVPEHCENPVAEQYELGIELGVSGTPALLTSSGQLIPGYVPPDVLRQRLDSMSGAVATK